MARRFTGKELPELGSWVRVFCKSNKVRDRAGQDAPALVTSVSSHEGDMVCSVVYPNELVLRGFVKGSPIKTLKGIAVSSLRKTTVGEVPALENSLLKSLTMLKSQQEADARKHLLQQSVQEASVEKSAQEAVVKSQSRTHQDTTVEKSVQETGVDKSVQEAAARKSAQETTIDQCVQRSAVEESVHEATVQHSVHEVTVDKPSESLETSLPPALFTTSDVIMSSGEDTTMAGLEQGDEEEKEVVTESHPSFEADTMVTGSDRAAVAASDEIDAVKCPSLSRASAPPSQLSSPPSARNRSRSPRTPAPHTPPRKTVQGGSSNAHTPEESRKYWNHLENVTKLGPDCLRLFTAATSRVFKDQCHSPARMTKQDLVSQLKGEFNVNEIDVGMKELEDRNKIMVFEDMVFRV